MENNSNKDHEIELLKLEYQQCQSGYNSRDGLAEDEFCKVIQKFSVFLTILLAFNIFIEISPAFHFLVCVIIGVAGLCCLFSLLIVIESNSGCNVALRKRCRQIEDRLKELTGFQIQYWQAIEDRPKRPEENIVKGIWGKKADRGKKRTRTKHFCLHSVAAYFSLDNYCRRYDYVGRPHLLKRPRWEKKFCFCAPGKGDQPYRP